MAVLCFSYTKQPGTLGPKPVGPRCPHAAICWLAEDDLSQRAHLPLSTTRLLKLCHVPGSVSNWERAGQHGDKPCHGALAEPTRPVGLRAGTTAAVTTPEVEPEARIQEQEVY